MLDRRYVIAMPQALALPAVDGSGTGGSTAGSTAGGTGGGTGGGTAEGGVRKGLVGDEGGGDG